MFSSMYIWLQWFLVADEAIENGWWDLAESRGASSGKINVQYNPNIQTHFHMEKWLSLIYNIGETIQAFGGRYTYVEPFTQSGSKFYRLTTCAAQHTRASTDLCMQINETHQ